MKRIIGFLIFSGCFSGFSQHSIVMKSGKKLTGVVFELKYDTLGVAINQKLTKIPLMRVSSILCDEFVPYNGKFVASEPEKTMMSGKYLIKYRMKDREMTEAPVISIGTQDKGTVVVDVTINRSGTVNKATPGAAGSTTSSEYLYIKAKFAAQGAKFSQHPTGPIEQDGTISITY